MTTIYLASIGTKPEVESLVSFNAGPVLPSVLVSFFYLNNFDKVGSIERLAKNKKMLDSGAYTAWSKKKTIDIPALVAEGKSGRWAETVGLDAIGDPKTSLANAETMQKAGLDVIPVFHFGEPWELLQYYKKNFSKVGLGGLGVCKSRPEKLEWVAECFAQVWPCKFHLFGWVQEEVLMKYPMHSADSTGWEQGALAFGRYHFAKGQNLGMRNAAARDAAGETRLRPEIQHYLKMQDTVQRRWSLEFKNQGWHK